MSILLCDSCDNLFDAKIQVEADYDMPLCEDCLNEHEEQLQQTWNQLDQDEQAIKEFLQCH